MIDSNNSNEDKFLSIANELHTMYKNKNRIYGNSYANNIDEFGNVAAIIPITNKVNRIKSLIIKTTENNFESLEDSLRDLACYSIMFLMELKK